MKNWHQPGNPKLIYFPGRRALRPVRTEMRTSNKCQADSRRKFCYVNKHRRFTQPLIKLSERKASENRLPGEEVHLKSSHIMSRARTGRLQEHLHNGNFHAVSTHIRISSINHRVYVSEQSLAFPPNPTVRANEAAFVTSGLSAPDLYIQHTSCRMLRSMIGLFTGVTWCSSKSERSPSSKLQYKRLCHIRICSGFKQANHSDT